MGSEYWNGVASRLPEFFKDTAAICLTADLLSRRHFCPGVFGWGFLRPPFYYYPTISCYPYDLYQMEHYTPGYRTYFDERGAGRVSKSQDSSLGRNLVYQNDTQFVTDKWVNLDRKPDKTDEETINLQLKYRNFLNNFAKSFIGFLDYKTNTGDKSGKISKEEFSKYYESQFATAQSSEQDRKKLRAEGGKVFEKLDVIRDKKLDWKEIAGMLAILDSANDGKYDGTISREEILEGLKNLAKNQDAKEIAAETYYNLYGRA